MTNDQRTAWAQDWEQPHMVAGMNDLKEFAATDGTLEGLPPGYDALVLAAAARWFAQGQASILKRIEDLKKQVKPQADPGPSFQAPREFRESRI